MAISNGESAYNSTFRLVSVCLFLSAGCQFLNVGYCRAVYHTGSATETEVSHFEFLTRLGNPCGIERVENNLRGSHSGVTVDSNDINLTGFYESMVLTANQGLVKLQNLLSADTSLPNCQGINLDTLPAATKFRGILVSRSLQSGIFLAAHFHIMGLDRQMSVAGLNDVTDENLTEHPEGLSSWRILRCGNETWQFMPRLEELTLQFEDMLCTIVSSASLDQRTSFRGPFDRLMNTTFFRYHSSCSTLQTRDCLVLREAKVTLTAIAAAFNTLLRESLPSVGNGRDHYEIHTNDISY